MRLREGGTLLAAIQIEGRDVGEAGAEGGVQQREEGEQNGRAQAAAYREWVRAVRLPHLVSSCACCKKSPRGG
ncbi:hypothetical protein ACIPPR_36205 [Streptomyces nigra]|uniref:hypothetical protein n=1 Tax=Streptomyces nigra TaxID=1827580 RepID=UPI0038108BB4